MNQRYFSNYLMNIQISKLPECRIPDRFRIMTIVSAIHNKISELLRRRNE
jgi:hypothetical protein